MDALGLVFSNVRDKNVSELTEDRIMASLPFGGRYTLLDFALSNLANAGISKIGCIVRNNYQSLTEHIGTGKDWDLSRKNGGIIVLPPFTGVPEKSRYSNRLEALKRITSFLDKCSEEYVIMADTDIVYNISYDDVLEQHKKYDADITVVYRKEKYNGSWKKPRILFDINKDNKITNLTSTYTGKNTENVSLNTMIMKLDFLKKLINDAKLNEYTSFSKQVFGRNLDIMDVRGYEYKDYYAYIDSVETYMSYNFDLLDEKKRENLFRAENRPIFTSVKDSPPTKYGKDAHVKNSIVADGCVIEGEVKNSILFRGVKVGKNSIVQNSVVMQETTIGDNASLNYVTTDKGVLVKDGRVLSGHKTYPFFIEKDSII